MCVQVPLDLPVVPPTHLAAYTRPGNETLMSSFQRRYSKKTPTLQNKYKRTLCVFTVPLDLPLLPPAHLASYTHPGNETLLSGFQRRYSKKTPTLQNKSNRTLCVFKYHLTCRSFHLPTSRPIHVQVMKHIERM